METLKIIRMQQIDLWAESVGQEIFEIGATGPELVLVVVVAVEQIVVVAVEEIAAVAVEQIVVVAV